MGTERDPISYSGKLLSGRSGVGGGICDPISYPKGCDGYWGSATVMMGGRNCVEKSYRIN